MISEKVSYEGYFGEILYDALYDAKSFSTKYINKAIKKSIDEVEYSPFRSDKLIQENRYYLTLPHPNSTVKRELNIREFPEGDNIRCIELHFKTYDYADVRAFAESQYNIAKKYYSDSFFDGEWRFVHDNFSSDIELLDSSFNFKPLGGLNRWLSKNERKNYSISINILYRRR